MTIVTRSKINNISNMVIDLKDGIEFYIQLSSCHRH